MSTDRRQIFSSLNHYTAAETSSKLVRASNTQQGLQPLWSLVPLLLLLLLFIHNTKLCLKPSQMASYPPYDPAAYQQPAAYPPAAADPNAYYAAAPPPAYAAAPPPYAYQPHPDEVRTLFITGFPEDVKERELNNMLRFLPAYEVSAEQVHY